MDSMINFLQRCSVLLWTRTVRINMWISHRLIFVQGHNYFEFLEVSASTSHSLYKWFLSETLSDEFDVKRPTALFRIFWDTDHDNKHVTLLTFCTQPLFFIRSNISLYIIFQSLKQIIKVQCSLTKAVYWISFNTLYKMDRNIFSFD